MDPIIAKPIRWAMPYTVTVNATGHETVASVLGREYNLLARYIAEGRKLPTVRMLDVWTGPGARFETDDDSVCWWFYSDSSIPTCEDTEYLKRLRAFSGWLARRGFDALTGNQPGHPADDDVFDL